MAVDSGPGINADDQLAAEEVLSDRMGAVMKTETTILAIVYHPEIRDVLTERGKQDIGKMIHTLAEALQPPGVCKYIKCNFADRCSGLCDWGAEVNPCSTK